MAPRSEDPKLIIRGINFELVQSICPAYVNVTDGRTDGRMTYDSNTALALRASRGKNRSTCTKVIVKIKAAPFHGPRCRCFIQLIFLPNFRENMHDSPVFPGCVHAAMDWSRFPATGLAIPNRSEPKPRLFGKPYRN